MTQDWTRIGRMVAHAGQQDRDLVAPACVRHLVAEAVELMSFAISTPEGKDGNPDGLIEGNVIVAVQERDCAACQMDRRKGGS